MRRFIQSHLFLPLKERLKKYYGPLLPSKNVLHVSKIQNDFSVQNWICNGFLGTRTRDCRTMFCTIFLVVSSISENEGFFRNDRARDRQVLTDFCLISTMLANLKRSLECKPMNSNE